LPGKAEQLAGWRPGKYYYQLNFSGFSAKGKYRLEVRTAGRRISSEPFVIEEHALASLTLPSIVHYYQKQRADKPEEVEADRHVILYGSNRTADVRGGWCDASGDISKYFSHLSYTNTMMPQQIPLVTWSLLNTAEQTPVLLKDLQMQDAIGRESAWGADYIMRSLSPEGYFYMTVFSYFNPDPNQRRIVGLLANSVTTSNYQCAFREGGGMAIAALARIAGQKQNGLFSQAQYLAAAKKAFAHLLLNNIKYDDDGRENIIDDYCALLAATELWITTGENFYRDEARKRAARLSERLSSEGYFIADDSGRPFWHASDAGLPVIALARYLDREKEKAYRDIALSAIRKSLSYELRVTNNTSNPFGYARQTFAWGNRTK
ncbi:MAG: glycoside hydrolase family 9 protein, partial [Bacteroidetes bacterium]|nr:glycoside hydrolase family 9 protein [Bacteroidota bacterium]